MKILNLKKIIQYYDNDGIVGELEIPFELEGYDLTDYIKNNELKINYLVRKLGVKWKYNGEEKKIITKKFNLYNFQISNKEDRLITVYPKDNFNSVYSFPNNIVVYSPNAEVIKVVEFPFMDYDRVYNPKTKTQELIRIEAKEREDNKKFEQGEIIGPFFNKTKLYNGIMIDRKELLIQFEKYTIQETEQLNKMGVKIDIKTHIKTILSCQGWEEYKYFDPYQGVFSQSYASRFV